MEVLRWVIGLVLAASALAATASGSQTGPQLSARLSTGVVKLGGQARLEVVIENATRARVLEQPEVEGLKIGEFQSPSRHESTLIYNGRTKRSVRLSYVVAVRPLAEGEFTIPPMTFEVDGQPMRTRPLPLKAVVDVDGAQFGFIEVVEVPETVYEGQPFQLVMRFGFDAGLSVNRAVLHLPWWGELAGTLAMEDPPRQLGGDWIEIAVNRSETIQVEETANEQRDGRAFRVFWLRKNFMATRPGTLDFPMSYLEFGRADRLGRARDTWYAHQDEFSLEVAQLPEEGRPYDYTNAVGTFAAKATIDRRDVDVGESIKLSVDFRGEGNLEFFDPPEPSRDEAFAGFKFYGRTERKMFGSRQITWDLAPRSTAVREVPPVQLRVFDPELGRYTTITSEAIPIRVRAIEGSEELSEGSRDEFGLDIRDVQGPGTVAPPVAGPGRRLIGGTLVFVPLVWLLGRTWVRRRGDPDDPARRRRRAARRRFARELRAAASASDEARGLHRFLAQRSLEPEWAWVGRDPVTWRSENETDMTEENARELATLFAQLDERVYVGGDKPLGASAILPVADRMLKGGL